MACCQKCLSRKATLDEILRTASKSEIRRGILDCYSAEDEVYLPLLCDGIGRSYPHPNACYYLFAWLIRDAPQQRLGPLIQRMVRNSGKSHAEAEVEALSGLIHKYRRNVRTFVWPAIREVILDRFEGSRRSIKGHEKETVVRTALLIAIQSFFEKNGDYGKYAGVEVTDKEIVIGNETFDVSINLIDAQGQRVRRILVPIKTRETEGGGHAHLFTRDIKSALEAARFDSADDFVMAVIVAKNWSEREKATIRRLADHAAIFDLSSNEFTEFGRNEQSQLNTFVVLALKGQISPKASVD